MSKSLKNLLIILSAFLFGILLSYVTRKKPVEPEPIIQRDTVVVYDTTVIEKPVPKYVTVIRRDTLLTEYWHLQHDTVMVEVPIEQKVFQEDSVYRAVISGWHTSLDSLLIYNKTTEITITKKLPAPKWSLGITAGPSMLLIPTGDIKFGMGVTAGVHYRF